MIHWPYALVTWYRGVKRDLPWRRTKDPYAIWVSEIMLQQTRVEAVMGYYTRFMAAFPTIAELAYADEDAVLKLWEGLGYYSRAKNLQRAARVVCERYGGIFPSEYEAVRALPGIGDYTAGAILSIAFDKPYPAVDGNVLRVMARLYGIQQDILLPKTKTVITDILTECYPKDSASDFAQSLMELGAMVCIPQTPRCGQCPICDHCSAYSAGTQADLPLRRKKEKPQEIQLRIAILRNEKGEVLMTRRPDTGLLAGLWEFPGVEARTEEEFEQRMGETYGLQIRPTRHLVNARHVFSHQVWQMQAYEARLERPAPTLETMRWVGEEDLDAITIPAAFARIRQVVFEELI
ncbi:A/G-specific adenine glycosylase [Bianquea renquensis]|uniref:Adenine DNA glycosylase n=1 Tax=Bianquea renquensis TaxID=2763661 RepID=A0A926DTI0_9FIRM|nr:A/G-specific adenine glycosylase [Bianquea renquensis]MBC8543459.1 A/G-specific adenine glycosylase [Bianquea renquensis]